MTTRTTALALIGATLITAPLHAQEHVREALIGLARVHRDGGNLSAAAREFADAQAIRPLTDAERIEYFWIVRSVQPETALAIAREILRRTPANESVRDSAIGAAAAIGDESAVVALATAGRQLSVNTTARWNRRLGDSYLRAGRLSEAADAYRTAAAAPDGEPTDQLSAATALTSAGRFKEAVVAWATVSPTLFETKPDLAKLRLLAFAKGAPPPSAIAELTAWLREHPDDSSIREWLVDAYAETGNYRAAYAAAVPPTGQGDDEQWLRRRGDLARRAGLHKEAMRAYEALLQRQGVTRADRLNLVDLYLASGDSVRSLGVIHPLVAALRACQDDLLGTLDRIDGQASTDLLRSTVERLGCVNSRWGVRVIERSMAERRFDAALEVLDHRAPLPWTDERLRGELQLWTGNAAAAVSTLEPVVKLHPDDLSGRLALVDALRAVQHQYDSMNYALPLYEDNSLPSARLLMLAELAIEADRPDLVEPLVARLEAHTATGQELVARARLEQGRARDAAMLFEAMDSKDMSPAGALAWIDALLATRGLDTATAAADAFTSFDEPWLDVQARRVTLTVVRQDGRGEEIGERLCAVDTRRCALARADAYLRLGQPDRALEALAPAPDANDMRVEELVAAAFEQNRQYFAALALVEDLRARTPLRESLNLRALVLTWRINPTDDNLAAVATYAATHSEDETLHVAAGLVLAEAARAKVAALVQRARDLAGRGEESAALTSVREALSIDSTYMPAWLAAVDVAMMTRDERQQTEVIDAFASATTHNPALLITVSEHVAATMREGAAPVAHRLVALLETVSSSTSITPTLTVARLHASLEEWEPALHAIERELQMHPQSTEGLRLRAEVLAWSGRHAAALQAYDRYLRAVPSDVNASRQQARIAGWAGRYGEANRRYVALQRRYPSDPVIAAEASAKRAFYAGRWQDAVSAYDAWLKLEPENSEAQFERAVSLRSAGAAAVADAALAELSAGDGHRLASMALASSKEARRPSVAITADRRSMSGYNGSRLLTLDEQLATLSFGAGRSRPATFSFSAGQVRAGSDLPFASGTRADAVSRIAVHRRLLLDGSIGAWKFSSMVTPVAKAGATWKWTDRIALAGGIQQQEIHENVPTVMSGLTGRGPFAVLRITTPTTSMETMVSDQRLSDRNRRDEVTFAAARVVSERLPSVRLIGWGQRLQYKSQTTTYFSPSSFMRLDGGIEYTYVLRRARFAGDRQDGISASFVEGTDNHAVSYHHPALRAEVSLSRHLLLEARGEWVRASTYRQSSLSVNLRVRNLAGD